MSVPISQMWTVASYVLTQRFRGRKQYPLVLMLEPLFRCNLACAGCGKIQYPGQILRKNLTVEQCLKAVDECGAPIVSIPGGEPLMYPDIGRLVTELVARKKYIYLCTNAILLKEKLEAGVFTPSKYLSFSIHMDGLREEHDEAVCKDGVFDQAVEGIREALQRGYRVTTNTTLFEGANPERVRQFFDAMMDLGVEGMMVSPGYSYSKAPDQEHFLRKQRANDLFTPHPVEPEARAGGSTSLRCSSSSSWGSGTTSARPGGIRPTTSSAGSARATSSRRATPRASRTCIRSTRWERYGKRSGNEKCRDCMVHCGFEATAVQETFASWRGFRDTVVATVHRACVMEVEKTLEGWAPEPDAEMPLARIVELAFDYRGNTTVVTRDGAELHGLRVQPRCGRSRAVPRDVRRRGRRTLTASRTRRCARSTSPGRTPRPGSPTPPGSPGSRRRRPAGRRAPRRRDAGIELTREGRLPRRRRPRPGGSRAAPAPAAGHPRGS